PFRRGQLCPAPHENPLEPLSLDKPRDCAEAPVTRHGRTLHVAAAADDMYAAIDLLTDKLERALVRAKEKEHDQARRTGGLARSGGFGRRHGTAGPAGCPARRERPRAPATLRGGPG